MKTPNVQALSNGWHLHRRLSCGIINRIKRGGNGFSAPIWKDSLKMISKIGVFDSGLGGLTVLNELVRHNPNLEIVYFGDTARVPYGSHSKDTITRYACQDVRFLLSQGVQAIVVACGTVSANALDHLHMVFDVPILGVIEPAVKAAVSSTKTNSIAIIGTVATIKSGAYEKLILSLSPDVKVTNIACPLLVPLVENGFLWDDPITMATCQRYLDPIAESDVDTVIMGCTHYPFLKPAFTMLYPNKRFIDMGETLALALSGELQLDPEPKQSPVRFCVSDLDTIGFLNIAAAYLDAVKIDKVETIGIDNY